jgi:glycerol uptake facilitator protein
MLICSTFHQPRKEISMSNKAGNFGVYLSEFIGTFIFLLCGIGCVAGLKLAGASLGQWEVSIVWGLAVAMGVYVCGGVCGAHLNPSVTIALTLFAGFDKRKVLPYLIAQFLAGFCAAATAYLVYKGLFDAAIAETGGDPVKMTGLAGIFCTFPHPKIGFFQAFLVEMCITAILMCLILALGDERNTAPGARLSGLLVGLLVALIGASFGPLTGFAMNAARDFGPRLFAFFAGWGSEVMTGYPLNANLSLPYFLVPLVAPVIGACIGAAVYKSVIGRTLQRA